MPIIAHPERNNRVQRSPEVLESCIDAGAVLQGTSGSFSRLFRKDSQKTFFELLARGWFSLLASDAHSAPEYTWSLGPMLAELGDRICPRRLRLAGEREPGAGVGRQAADPHGAEAAARQEPAQVRLAGLGVQAPVSALGLDPPVAVLEADDVVLAQVVSRLDLDDLHRLRARVGEAVRGSGGT